MIFVVKVVCGNLVYA
ncbi:hypothetical protein M2G83_21010, partial [Vibrio vulnificus]|nr:hypothetical protein [Vibrio vulnificus]